MKLVIVGAGKIGSTLVEELSLEGHDIVVVDICDKTVESLVNKHDVIGIVGGGADREILKQAEVDKADFFIASTSRDELNVLCCMLAKKMGARMTIARVRDPEYYSEEQYMAEELGIDMLFNPELKTAEEMALILRYPTAISIDKFADGAVLMLQFLIQPNNPIIGKSVADIVKEYNTKILLSVVERNDEVYIPRGDFVINLGDRVYVTAGAEDISQFIKTLQIYKKRSKSVFVVGGGKIGYYLAKQLLADKVKVTLIDMDEDICKQLSETLPDAEILCGDGSDQEVLEEEDIASKDACVALTGIDEENVIISLYASTRNVPKVIAKVDRPTVAKMARQIGIDSAISPSSVIVNHILRFIRAHRPATTSRMDSLYKIGETAEAVEFKVTEQCAFLNTPLRDIAISKDYLVNGIVRDKQFILPSGDSQLMVGDDVLIVSAKNTLMDLNDILK